MLKAALSGGYVNFGVLRLYGDDALENALGMFIKLLGSIEQKDIMVCTKQFSLEIMWRYDFRNEFLDQWIKTSD